MPSRQKLEALLATSPADLFLRYAVAMACASEGAPAEAIRRLAAINQDHPDDVAAWFQRGQLLAKTGEPDAARTVLESGIAAARRVADDHAAGEMAAFIDMLS